MTNAEKVDFIIEEGSSYLNEWESSFIDSIQDFISKYPDTELPWKQWKNINKIYRKIENNIG